jgi:predicted ester cyclase
MGRSQAARIEAANTALLVKGETSTVEEYFALDHVAHGTDRDMTGGPAWVRRYLRMLHDAFSDLEVDVEILVESDDRVAWQRRVRGVHAGAYAGFPPTGRRVIWRDMVATRFDGGRIAEEWVVSDLAERLLADRKE